LTLQLYILRQLLVGIVFSIGGMIFVAVPGLVVNAVHKLGGVGMAATLGYLPLVMVDLVPYMLPIGFLLAVVAGYGRLAHENEWTAMCMAGWSPYRLALPGLALALVMAGGTHYLVSYVAPGMRFERRDYAKRKVVESFRKLPPGQTELSLGDFYMNARWREERGDDHHHFRDVHIHVPPSETGEVGQTILADELELFFEGDEMVVALGNARYIFADTQGFSEELVLRRDLNALFETAPRDRGGWKYQTTPVIFEMLAASEVPEHDVRKARFEVHDRIAIGCACILFLLLGMPTGLILRRGTQLGALATSVGYALAYYVLSMRLGKALGESGACPEWIGAWSTTGIGLVLGFVLVRKAVQR
jgi:lipopolysaccharide export LptBFGC system permease protein LptF